MAVSIVWKKNNFINIVWNARKNTYSEILLNKSINATVNIFIFSYLYLFISVDFKIEIEIEIDWNK